MRSDWLQMAFLLAVTALAVQTVSRRLVERHLLECKRNLRIIATALEMYASDNNGSYPRNLRRLPGLYLKELPSCPVTGSDYCDSYRVVASPDSFSFGCLGRHHSQCLPPDSRGYPWYDAEVSCHPEDHP